MKTAKIIVVILTTIAINIAFSVSYAADRKKTIRRNNDASTTSERRLALVIGNADYKNAPLRNPVNDANDMEKTLKSLGFEVISRTNAGHKEMEDAIREFGSKLRRSEFGLFFYSGHGVQYNGANFLIPTDADILKETDFKYKTVQADMILDEMNQAGNRMNVVILDACRSNPFQRGFKSVRQGLAQMNAPEDRQILIAYATASNSVAADGSRRNSPYTENLLRYMVKPGLKVDDVFKKVRSGVINDTNNQQFPWIAGSFSDDFYFATGMSSEPAAVQTSESGQKPKYHLRRKPITVSDEDALKTFRLKKEDGLWRPLEYIKNESEDNGDGTITDYATGLMWQKSGSPRFMEYENAKTYIENLNRDGFAGHKDWRLPTLDELKSLLTPKRMNGDLYIDPLFNKIQRDCWTSDQRAPNGLWLVYFLNGNIGESSPILGGYVRAVRSLQ